LKSDSRSDGVRLASPLAAAILLAAIATASAQSKPAAAAAPPSWLACAGGSPSQFVLPMRRLTALNDKALVEADVAKVFAQREKEQRVSAANLAKARLSIDFLYVAGDGTRRQYYFEASKTIPDAGALLRVAVSGWLRGDGGLPRSLGSRVELHWIETVPEDPDGEHPVIPDPPVIPEPTAALVPQGVFVTAAEHVWVMRRAIGSSPLMVYEVKPGRVWLRPKSAAKACA
jgi:hypothetical protein